jgi:hypothetical protein
VLVDLAGGTAPGQQLTDWVLSIQKVLDRNNNRMVIVYKEVMVDLIFSKNHIANS